MPDEDDVEARDALQHLVGPTASRAVNFGNVAMATCMGPSFQLADAGDHYVVTSVGLVQNRGLTSGLVNQRRSAMSIDLGDQSGRTAIITGANSGLGKETAIALAAAGADVVLACRNLDKANAVAAEIGPRRASSNSTWRAWSRCETSLPASTAPIY